MSKKIAVCVQQDCHALQSEHVPLFHVDKAENLQDLLLGKNWYATLPLREQESHLKFRLYLPQHISQKFKLLFQMPLLHVSKVTSPAV